MQVVTVAEAVWMTKPNRLHDHQTVNAGDEKTSDKTNKKSAPNTGELTAECDNNDSMIVSNCHLSVTLIAAILAFYCVYTDVH